VTVTASGLVFVPGLGFRSREALMLREPVSYEAEGWTVNVESVTADGSGTQVAVTIHGPFKMKGEGHFGQPDLDYNAFIQARNRSGAVSSSGPRMFPMSTSVSHAAGVGISCTANMDALPGSDSQVDILIGEPLPITVIPLRLTPIADLAIPARSLEVSDEHHGVALTAHAVARGADMTAVLLHATLQPHLRQRFMRALGTMRDAPRQAPGITIADDRGSDLTAFAATRELSAGPEMRTIAVFPGLAADASAATLTVPYVVLSEYLGAPVKLAVPSEGEVTLGDDTAFVRVDRKPAPRGGPAVAVEFSGAWRDDRRLLYAESLSVDGQRNGGVGFGQTPGEPPILTYAEDPSGNTTSVQLESPVVQLRGPWRLPLVLP
jgi:hypothetical protein